MVQTILALLAGTIVGFLFSLIKLPLPAPPNLAGLAGVAGVLLGYKVYEWLIPFLKEVFK
ncbi:MAG: hypothetical protein K0S51_1395 [Bacillales bacterium]|jgi:XapX domain-containing protein|nr:hypothetical protein [Bacillales bacterium]